MSDSFWQKVKKTPTCWIWQGGVNGLGYGYTRVAGKMVAVHRLAYQLQHGHLPHGGVIMHSCDNRLCCNPLHLSHGTHKANSLDMVLKNRHRPRQFGDKGRHQLTFTKGD